MTRGHGRWVFVLVLGLWLSLTPIALAGQGIDDFTIRMTLSRTMVAPGDAIQATGSGAVAGVAVDVLIVQDPSSGANPLTSTQVMPDANGNFSATITVPGTATTGRYAVRAEQPPGNGGLVDQYYWVGICVNQCTGESLSSLLPETGGPLGGGATLPLILSGLLVSGLVAGGLRRAAHSA